VAPFKPTRLPRLGCFAPAASAQVGHASQNAFLQAQALGLGAAVVGAFDEARMAALLRLPANEKALYLMPVGRRASP